MPNMFPQPASRGELSAQVTFEDLEEFFRERLNRPPTAAQLLDERVRRIEVKLDLLVHQAGLDATPKQTIPDTPVAAAPVRRSSKILGSFRRSSKILASPNAAADTA